MTLNDAEQSRGAAARAATGHPSRRWAWAAVPVGIVAAVALAQPSSAVADHDEVTTFPVSVPAGDGEVTTFPVGSAGMPAADVAATAAKSGECEVFAVEVPPFTFEAPEGGEGDVFSVEVPPFTFEAPEGCDVGQVTTAVPEGGDHAQVLTATPSA